MNITYVMHEKYNLCYLAVRGSAEIETVLKTACAGLRRICSQLFHHANRQKTKQALIIDHFKTNYL